VIRQAKRWFAVAQLLPAAIAVALTLMIVATQPDPVGYGTVVVPAIALVAAYMSTVFATAKPYKWGHTAAGFGAWAGLGPGLALGFVLHQPAAYALTLVTAAIGWFAGRQLGATAVRHVDGLRLDELADTDLELRFRARDNAFVGLRVGPREVIAELHDRKRHRMSTCLLEDIATVEPHSVQAASENTLPGERGVPLTLTPGPAVLLREPAGEWVFPTDQADQAVRLIDLRAAPARARLAEILADADDESE
jgi:hypothetical protein